MTRDKFAGAVPDLSFPMTRLPIRGAGRPCPTRWLDKQLVRPAVGRGALPGAGWPDQPQRDASVVCLKLFDGALW